MDPKRRILIKLSGEYLAGKEKSGFHIPTVKKITKEIVDLVEQGIQIGIVIGGGNFYRGINDSGNHIKRVSGDYMGMLATIINAVALKDFFESFGQKATVMSALKVEKLSQAVYPHHAIELLNKGHVVIFAGGTGNPFFTTDTAGVLRAIEIEADMMLKATRVDGVYSDDPEKNPQAVKYDKLSYREALEKGLKIMDSTAFALAKENHLKIIVFNLNHPDALQKIVLHHSNIGTIIE